MNFPLILLLLAASLPQQAELEKRIGSYWDLLLAQDKNAALQYVEPESRNRFIQRRTPYFRSWEPMGIEEQSETKALVRVRIDRLMEASRSFYKMPVKEVWVLGDEGWHLQLPQLTSKALGELYSGRKEEKPAKKLTGELRLLPQSLKIHFLNQTNRGSVFLFNGLSVPVQVTRIEYDKEKFILEEKVGEVASGEKAKISIRYLGDEEDKDLTSELRVFVEGGSEEGGGEMFDVPVLYNHLSPAARALFGLNEARAKELERGDPFRPTVQAPEPPKDGTQVLPPIPPSPPKKSVATPKTQAE